jgi:alpha,alpha-trehalase
MKFSFDWRTDAGLQCRQMSDKITTDEFVFDKTLIHKALDHIETKWHDLRRFEPEDNGTLIGLPYPYLVPSTKSLSAFLFDEMYYWDNYFIALGLIKTGHRKLARGMAENLLHLVRRFDIAPNSNRFYATGHSQPPLLTSYIFEIYEYKKDLAWLQDGIATAQHEYATVWLGTKQPNWRNVFHGLSRYYDINVLDSLAEAESGWDMTTRFSDHCLSYIPIDLNALLYKYEIDFARHAEIVGDQGALELWKGKAKERQETVNAYLWNEEKGFFFDYNYVENIQSKVWSLAGFYPLWTGMATEEQAARMVKNLTKFMHDGGLSTTASPTTPHNPDHKHNHQWAYPNGWAPLHWLVIRGLERYGYKDEAAEIAKRWLKTNLDYYKEHGVFREAYNVVTPTVTPEPGVYPPQLGFGWTNGVFIDLGLSYIPEVKHWIDHRKPKKPKVKRVLKKVKTLLQGSIQTVKEKTKVS